ncbi:hypothetical protein MLD38_024625 [Melastoma candidum]|uniref:Uncharacterized protein n=1 Tax=Melastoma candidum TaxID=119954 RepID=A0ACB9NSW5_9MYRT|nr:hypothetical protein MLD38_024625 [Melastoma candidum]
MKLTHWKDLFLGSREDWATVPNPPPPPFLPLPSSLGDVSYSCGSCGYELNLSSLNRIMSTIGSKYRKLIKRGRISFFDVDESRTSFSAGGPNSSTGSAATGLEWLTTKVFPLIPMDRISHPIQTTQVITYMMSEFGPYSRQSPEASRCNHPFAIADLLFPGFGGEYVWLCTAVRISRGFWAFQQQC